MNTTLGQDSRGTHSLSTLWVLCLGDTAKRPCHFFSGHCVPEPSRVYFKIKNGTKQPSSTKGSPFGRCSGLLSRSANWEEMGTQRSYRNTCQGQDQTDVQDGWTGRQRREQTYRMGRMSALPEAKPRANAG